MKFKLDENLGHDATAFLVQAGHDVETVPGEGLCGVPDRTVLDACRSEARCLVTLDTEFANPLVFPPDRNRGIVVLCLPGPASRGALLAALAKLLDAQRQEAVRRGSGPDGELWIVEPSRVRIHQLLDPPFDE